MQKPKAGEQPAVLPDEVPLGLLLPLLREEKVALDRILSLTKSERDATGKHNLRMLEDVISTKRDALSGLQDLERRRQELLDTWAAGAGLAEKRLTVSDLLGLAPADRRSELAIIQSTLADLVEEVSEANKVNAALLVQLLESVQHSLSFVVSLQSREFAYSANGAPVTTKRSMKTIIERCA
jgi:flagellar biosynthesis/type III secretory pathway chaperone